MHCVFVFLFPLSTTYSLSYRRQFKERAALDSIAFTDIIMCPGPNNYVGNCDYHHPILQAPTEDVLVATISLCPSSKIIFFGDKPNQYSVDSSLSIKGGFMGR